MSVGNEIAFSRRHVFNFKVDFLCGCRLIRPQIDENSDREFILVKSQRDIEHQMKNQTNSQPFIHKISNHKCSTNFIQ